MGIFTADEWLAAVFRQKSLDSVGGSIHLALHIAGIVIPAVVEDAFIMHQTGGIKFPEEFGHLIDIPAAV